MATQAERRANTRQALLDAAAALLIEEGLAGFTTAAVTQRAGLSNGALFGHFPTRLDLLAATLEHLLAGLRVGYERTFAGLVETGASPETLLELLWESMNGPVFGAVLGVYTQARTDAELLAAIHDIVVQHGSFVGQINRRVVSSLVPDPQQAARTAGLGTIAILAMQGLVVSNMVGASMGAHRDLVGIFADLFEQQRTAPPGSAAASPSGPAIEPSGTQDG
jgi:AcrR family transcriptional regulator